jgi:hypothetical protein
VGIPSFGSSFGALGWSVKKNPAVISIHILRLEGPFVWYFRGYPHVHVWVNVADDASVKLNAPG